MQVINTRHFSPALLLLPFYLLIITLPAMATTRYVKAGSSGAGASWSDASGDLQVMITASASGDEVWVTTGSYQPASGQSFAMKAGVKIYGGFLGTETAIAQRIAGNRSDLLGNGNSVISNIAGLTVSALLDGFTISGGTRAGVLNTSTSPSFNDCYFTSNSGPTGGGMYNYNHSSPTVTNCVFTNNTTAGSGGGMHNDTYSSPTVTNCTFKNNNATTAGGGMRNISYSNPVLLNCTFETNTTPNYGGGMSTITNSLATLTNCTFKGNTSSYYGGGTYTVSNGSISLTGCLFDGNTAPVGGGAYSRSATAVQLNNCSFINNTADAGGAVYNGSATPVSIVSCTFKANKTNAYGAALINEATGACTIANCLFSGNYSGSQGGAIYNSSSATSYLTNCTIAGNYAGNASGAVYNTTPSTLYYRNCIVYNNNSGIITANSTYTFNSLVQNFTGTANNNISGTTDPLFVNAVTPGLSTGGDYQLQPCSPAINAGSNTLYNSGQTPDLSAITTTLNTATRIQGTAVDMGAYEYAGDPGGADLLAIQGDVANPTISGTTILKATGSSCRTIATIQPTGTSTALTGTVNSYVWIETTQPANYVKRHYQLTPATNASTATANVTLYFTQAEFDAFNAVNAVKLPTSANDASGIANLLVEKFAGTSSNGTGLPLSYPGNAITINPNDADIVWNSTLSRWEVSFAVTGFSGFFVKTQTSTLPLTLLSFTGSQYNGYNQLKWITTDEVNTQQFIVERSADGSTFNAVATLAANGSGNGNYTYKDYSTFSGKLYYRLKMVDNNGSFTYSPLVTLINNGSSAVSIYPNPASNSLTINAGAALANSRVGLYSISGKLLQTIIITGNTQTINIQTLAAGVYTLQFANGAAVKFIKH